MLRITFSDSDKTTKVKQIVKAIKRDIECGILEENFKLPSVNALTAMYPVSRDTIDKAFRELRKDGFITSVPGKGCYVGRKKDTKLKILLVFDELSSFKKIVFYELLKTLGEKAKVDLKLHHYEYNLLNDIITTNLGEYHYYVVIPHFIISDDRLKFLEIFKKIPPEQLIFLDKNVPELGKDVRSIFQDFSQDVFDALNELNNPLKKYDQIKLIFSTPNNHPLEIIEGIRKFCSKTQKQLFIIETVDGEVLQKGCLYVVITEEELGKLIRKCRLSNLEAGKDIGIISYNESILKELLDITVITTDFIKMGRTAANVILNNEHEQIRNPFAIIRRNSV